MDWKGSSHFWYQLCLCIRSHVESSIPVLVGWMYCELCSFVVQWREGANRTLVCLLNSKISSTYQFECTIAQFPRMRLYAKVEEMLSSLVCCKMRVCSNEWSDKLVRFIPVIQCTLECGDETPTSSFKPHTTIWLCFWIMKFLLISMIVLITICGADSLCSKEIYDSYLSVYPVKCEGDCDEHKE